MTSPEGWQKKRGPLNCFPLPILGVICYKEMGHENYKKGLGFIALAPSFPCSGRIVAGAEKPGRRLLCFLGLLLQQELPHAFLTIVNA